MGRESRAFLRLTSGQMGSPETQGFKGAGQKVMQYKRNRPEGKKERREEVRRDAVSPLSDSHRSALAKSITYLL